MSPAPWACRSCFRALRRGPVLQVVRTLSSDASSSSTQSFLTPALLQRAHALVEEHNALQSTLSSSFDPAKAKRAGELSRVATALQAFEKAKASVEELSSLIETEPKSQDDAELASIAREELEAERASLNTLARDLGASLTPRDAFADFPCMIEFRPGPGGTESRYFTDTLFQMYKALCLRRGYRANVLKYETADSAGDKSSSANELPLQEAVLEVLDPGAYDIFRSEAGMHRVQRIPSTESKGRVHTSVSAIWTESAIRITHIPTGEVVSMQDHRSQQRNRQEAWKLLRSRIHRGEKIRTYNYNQDRCTDHRAGFDVHNLPDVLEGGETLDKVMTAAKEWLVGRDIELLTLEEEAKAAKK
ncbi:unnamed protein product [Clonostachys rosea f. rosea IK726]|uniref:Peptide chain release factor domain-containing protein n=2 Tax=Bionectria ochroleuca TaxID=29856 RepID=A0A0B7KAG7_BIOOC|nr:unnamed protein product [Clonostachys rosea f. rosea IK726]